MRFLYLIDSRGNKSATLTFVTLTWIASTVYLFTDESATLTQYAAAITGSLIAWVGREKVRS